MSAPLAITIGEPAGIGPEIICKAWRKLGADLPGFVIADPRHLRGLDAPVIEIEAPEQATEASRDGVPVLPHPFPSTVSPGQPDAANAQSVIDVIERAVGLVRAGTASALVTAPINKQVLKEGAGFAFPGHTEFLAHLGGCKDVVMMLACDTLRVVPATIHIPLSDVAKALTQELLRRTIEITKSALIRDFGIPAPRIAVAGLNPHAGEGGLMGSEDRDTIAPVLTELRQRGLDLQGPLPADTMFHAQAREGYDAALAMYHDQALIPIKTLDFFGGVNVTLGLPFIRTSPDHGTAFAIAGSGKADATSMIEAMKLARDMALARGRQ